MYLNILFVLIKERSVIQLVKSNYALIALTCLFLLGIIFFSYRMFSLGILTVLSLFLLYRINFQYRPTLSLFVFFFSGFVLFILGNDVIAQLGISKEVKIILNRSLLFVLILGTVISIRRNKQGVNLYTVMPHWNDRIEFPNHTIKTLTFLGFGFLGSMTIFLPLLLMNSTSISRSLLIFALVFSLINAVLEELLWRGLLLSSLKKYISTFYAVLVTSIGFGLLHLSIGIPILMSLSFSFGGLFYALVVLKTKSIYPAVLFHFVINIGMVLNGWIL
ncbi:CPBP family intramembrane glutamic endopeptidase [Fictibacillus phosphorivorans]|uniref:CPBP family intramembrane glutamic endopeptidase n=2 Tax=Fictibacillus TaxID=1329200 RepID=UPI0028CB9491|nr:type II CAAX endopeptidase family protein [Fictibacillus phosphorivorans]